MRIFIMLALLTLALGCILAGGFDTAKGELLALRVAKAPAIDGTLTGWNLTAAEEMARYLSDPMCGSARYALNYGEAGIYLLAEVKDPTPLMNAGDPAKHEGRQGDAVTLCLDPGNGEKAGGPYRFTCWYNHLQKKVYWEVEHGKGIYLPAPGVQAAMKADTLGLGYVCTALLPWATFGLQTAPAENSRWAGIVEVVFGNPEGTKADFSICGLLTGNKPETAGWGKIVFGAAASTRAPHPTLAQLAPTVLVDGAKNNGSFEDAELSPWYTGFYGKVAKPADNAVSVLRNADVASDGNAYVRIRTNGALDGKRSQGGVYLNVNDVDPAKGRTFVFSYDVRMGATAFSGVSTEFLFFGKDNALLERSIEPDTYPVAVADRWSHYQYTAVLPAGVTEVKFIQLRLVYYSDGGDPNVTYEGFVDNVLMVQVEK